MYASCDLNLKLLFPPSSDLPTNLKFIVSNGSPKAINPKSPAWLRKALIPINYTIKYGTITPSLRSQKPQTSIHRVTASLQDTYKLLH